MGTTKTAEEAARAHINGWSVTYETRRKDAIGAFLEPKTVYVIADDKATALRWAMEDLNAKGFETRFPLQAQRLGEALIKSNLEIAAAMRPKNVIWTARLRQMWEECQ